jgi:transcriptional regulator with XRE-family HTH domain
VTRLPGGRVTELHRAVGAELEASWVDLPREVVQDVQRTVDAAPVQRGAAIEPSALGVWLQKKRLAAGLSQEKLAADLGIARSMVSMVETGEHPGLPEPVLKLLAKMFNVRAESLLKLESGQASYKLPGHGVTDAHRDAALALGARWTRLPKATLEELRSLIDRGRSG